MSKRKVVVIGAGPAGYVCGIRLAQLGQDVTVVEKQYWGGTCLNVGCIPSKALIAAGSLMEKIRHADVMGISASDPSLDVGKLVEWKTGIVGKLTGGVAGLLKNHGANMIEGAASIVDKNTVKVVGKDGEQTLKVDDIVIATGSEPINIPGFTCDEKDVWSSTGALKPDSIPAHLLVIGGGYIGLELGMMYAKLGSKVTVLEGTGGALPGQERDCVKVIERSMKKMGMKLMTETFARASKKGTSTSSPRRPRRARRRSSAIRSSPTVGRRPTARAGARERRPRRDQQGFLEVDTKMRTKVPKHLRDRRHRRPADARPQGLQGGPRRRRRHRRAGRGVRRALRSGRDLHEPGDELRRPHRGAVQEKGLEYKTGSFPFAASGRAMTLRETDGFVKIIGDAETDEVLGVHMVGPEVTELIAEAALAIEMGATVEDLGRTIHAHPTLPEAMMEAAESLHGMVVHIYQKPKK